MIPNLPLDTNPLEVPKFYRQIVENLEMRSMHHESWHTHKRDSSVCWICDLLEVSKLCVGEMERYISKSALDIDEQFLVQEINSEGESVDYNCDEEIENDEDNGASESDPGEDVQR